jgi:WD40 repeat protein
MCISTKADASSSPPETKGKYESARSRSFSIIKVFDRETFHLQASLHGHTDYITEIDISKCNKFIASAGKDAQIIIWELATGKLLYRLHHHQRLINCVKFFTPKQTTADQGSTRPGSVPTHQQYLFSCSDDGTVRLYDLTAVSGWASNKQADKTHGQRSSEEDNFQIRRSNRQRNLVHSTASEQ